MLRDLDPGNKGSTTSERRTEVSRSAKADERSCGVANPKRDINQSHPLRVVFLLVLCVKGFEPWKQGFDNKIKRDESIAVSL